MAMLLPTEFGEFPVMNVEAEQMIDRYRKPCKDTPHFNTCNLTGAVYNQILFSLVLYQFIFNLAITIT